MLGLADDDAPRLLGRQPSGIVWRPPSKPSAFAREVALALGASAALGRDGTGGVAGGAPSSPPSPSAREPEPEGGGDSRFRGGAACTGGTPEVIRPDVESVVRTCLLARAVVMAEDAAASALGDTEGAAAEDLGMSARADAAASACPPQPEHCFERKPSRPRLTATLRPSAWRLPSLVSASHASASRPSPSPPPKPRAVSIASLLSSLRSASPSRPPSTPRGVCGIKSGNQASPSRSRPSSPSPLRNVSAVSYDLNSEGQASPFVTPPSPLPPRGVSAASCEIDCGSQVSPSRPTTLPPPPPRGVAAASSESALPPKASHLQSPAVSPPPPPRGISVASSCESPVRVTTSGSPQPPRRISVGSTDNISRRGRSLAIPTQVLFLLDAADCAHEEGEVPATADGAADLDRSLAEATFQDRRWANATEHLRARGILQNRAEVQALLGRGAKAFGLWCVSEPVLEGLVAQLLEEGPGAAGAGVVHHPSPALRGWLAARVRRVAASESDSGGPSYAPRRGAAWRSRKLRQSATITVDEVERFARMRARFGQSVRVRRLKLLLVTAVTVISFAIASPWRDTPARAAFGAGLGVARVTGVGTLLWTALLFLSVSRSLITWLYSCLPGRSIVGRCLDANHAVHMFCGKMLFLFSMIHTIAHLLSTYRVFADLSVETLNAVLKCATDGNRGYVQMLEWPECPLQRRWRYGELVFAATGLTGFALLAVISVLAYTGAQSVRSKRYDVFFHVHNVGLVIWILLLFWHGSQGWFGPGIPLVVPVCAVPCGCYLYDRVIRVVRYYLYTGRSVQILSAVIRPGKGGGANGALTALQVKKPRYLCNFRAGMYAYLNLPGYASWQWHPFTIVSGREDETVDFIISGIGDWTIELAEECLEYQRGARPKFPRISIDGPYAAPVTTALCSQVLIAVGAGVGITPFLALMANIIATLGDGAAEAEETHRRGGRAAPALREVHFFWITRSADEFLFGRHHFTRIMSDPRLRDKVFLHLHLTFCEPEPDAPAYLFREALRRQSRIDREAFLEATRDMTAEELAACSGPELPWCWAHGAERHDVLWVRSLIETEDHEEEAALADAFADHWAEGASAIENADSREAMSQKKSGHLLRRRTTSSMANACAAEPEMEAGADVPLRGPHAMLPITFGRPDFATEIQTIGKAWPDCDVDVYACGNSALVASLRDVCRLCTSRAAGCASASFKTFATRTQKYNFRFEDFGGG